VPNAVNTAHFAQSCTGEAIAQKKAELGKKPGEVFLVTTSRMVHKNGLDTVIEALPYLPATVTFLIYGGGPDKEKLEALAEELNVASRVRFMGLISHADMPHMLKACDIFIRPSRSEGMGNSFVEAMAARLPVIATHAGGIADFLFDRVRNPRVPSTGFAVDIDSPAQIAEQVAYILSHETEVAQVVEQAYQLAVTRYDWNLIAHDMLTKVFIPTITKQ
jgi:phosphatidylinositol alpha-1,6-mannosyltransferase